MTHYELILASALAPACGNAGAYAFAPANASVIAFALVSAFAIAPSRRERT